MKLGFPELLILFGCVGGVVVFFFAVEIIICFLLYRCWKVIPPAHRTQEPGMVWLLMIPCFNLIWNFFIYPGLAKSFRSYFNHIGRADLGDCGEGIGLAYSICRVCTLIPSIGGCIGLAALVLLIIFLFKVHDLKRQALEIQNTWATPPPPLLPNPAGFGGPFGPPAPPA